MDRMVIVEHCHFHTQKCVPAGVLLIFELSSVTLSEGYEGFGIIFQEQIETDLFLT